MRKLITAALVFAAMLGTPTVASARDRDGWNDRDRHEWSDRRDWRDDRDRRYWRDRDRRHHRWSDRRRHHYAGRNVVCRTEWYHGDRRRVCYRR